MSGESWKPVRTASIWGTSLVALAVFTVLLCIGACVGFPCFTTGFRHGMWIGECPSGEIRVAARVEAHGLLRGEEGTVSVLPIARYLRGHGSDLWVAESTIYRGAGVALRVLDAAGDEVPGVEVGRGRREGGWRAFPLTLPDLPDGDYTLRAVVSTGRETVEVDVALPLYAPALAHLMTDRPLYRPGQEVLLRSVTLRRDTLAPLAQRPGRWRITDPGGDELLLERGRAGALGVADTSFPLDAHAAVGTWRAAWETGEARDEVPFDVRPFRLPRFTVDVGTDARWYGVGDTVRIEGVARYTSGAPVAAAPVSVQLRVAEGRWPLPLAWEAAFEGRTEADGRYEITIGRVPPDLIERSVVSVTARVTEAAGEVGIGAARAVLSKDDLRVEAVTELGDGLVGGFNNRAYLRVSTPDGRPIPGAEVQISNPWDPLAEPRAAMADEDGVLAVQLDPGAPVTVMIPAPPVRVRPVVPAAPALSAAREVASERSLDLAERRALDALHPAIARCGDLAPGGEAVSVGVRVASSGAVREVLGRDTDLAACVAEAQARARFPEGDERTYALTWEVPDSLIPTFPTGSRAAFGGDAGVAGSLSGASRRARRCVPRDVGVSGATVLTGHWRVRVGSTALDIAWQPASDRAGLDPAQRACVLRAFTGLRLAEPAVADGMGVASVQIAVPSAPGSSAPQPMATTGYELALVATVDGAKIGETRAVLPVGAIPPLRLRATPSIARPGETVKVELFRGPDYTGELPKKLILRHGTLVVAEAPLDPTTRAASFDLPDDRHGFLHVDVGDARVVVFVRPTDPLSVEVQPDKASYRPGETATLTITTRAGDAPGPAAVGLVGVDSALAQLAPLLGPDDFGRVTVRAEASRPAFGAFDPRALALGQVRGENAAKAAVLRISQLPMDPAGDAYLSVRGASTPNDEEVLVTSFYRALEALHARVRAWEDAAPTDEVMTPDRMVRIWDHTLTELRKQRTPANDAFGLPLTLDRLPPDLLGQVDPRVVVNDKTRLPEDVVSWERYVAQEVRR